MLVADVAEELAVQGEAAQAQAHLPRARLLSVRGAVLRPRRRRIPPLVKDRTRLLRRQPVAAARAAVQAVPAVAPQRADAAQPSRPPQALAARHRAVGSRTGLATARCRRAS